MIDLDAVEARSGEAHKLHEWAYDVGLRGNCPVCVSLQDVPALVAELRTTRQQRDELIAEVARLRDRIEKLERGPGV